MRVKKLADLTVDVESSGKYHRVAIRQAKTPTREAFELFGPPSSFSEATNFARGLNMQMIAGMAASELARIEEDTASDLLGRIRSSEELALASFYYFVYPPSETHASAAPDEDEDFWNA